MKGWLIGAACAAVLAGQVWLSLTGSPVVPYELAALGGFGVLVAVVRTVRASRRGARAASVVRPGVQGLGEVQDIYLGRRPVPPVTWSSTDGVVAEQVTDRQDPLQRPVWSTGPDV
ncbi:MAG TPA: hypothetical protein VGC67_06330 [Cellulomonas sp.]